MKKLMFALCFLFGAAIAVNAQDTTSTEDQSRYKTDEMPQQHDQHDDDMGKEEISVAQLPAPVRDHLQSQDYTGWAVAKAYRKQKDDETIYAVELKSGDEIKKLKFDAQGNLLKEKEKKDRDQ